MSQDPDPQTRTAAPAEDRTRTAPADTHSEEPAVEPSAPLDFLAPPQQPDELGRLGPYRVLAEIGRGGMGVVFRADEPQLRRLVALKVMLPRYAANPVAKERFLREARAAAKVEHDHVVPVYRVEEGDGTPWLAMPLLQGTTLHAVLAAGRPPVVEAVRVGREVAEGLAAAHGQGLIHHDIKPANVWLEGPRRRVKILDFGLARAVGEEDAGPTAADVDPETAGGLTRTGAVIGTPAYMSPEQSRGEPVDARTDVFSLGVVLYQMTAGRRPFTGPGLPALAAAINTETPVPPVEMNPDVPGPLSALILRLLEKDPAARPQSAAEAAAELRQIELGLAAAVPVQAIALDADPWSDIEQPADSTGAHPVVSLPAAPRHRPVRLWVVTGLTAVLAAGLCAPVIVRAFTPSGVLLVQTDDPSLEIVVRRNGEVVRDRTTDRRFTLPPAEYTVELADPRPELNVTPGRVALARDGRETVHVWTADPRPAPVVPPAPPRRGSSFFNGKDLTGWRGKPGFWRVENGDLIGAIPPDTGATGQNLLRTDMSYSDFELSYQVSATDSWSGVMFRGTERGAVGGVLRGPGYSFNLQGRGVVGGQGTDGPLVEKGNPFKGGAVGVAQLKDPTRFNDVALRCVGRRVSVVVNGVQVADQELPIPAEGVIAWRLQSPGGAGQVVYRNIRFHDLGPAGDPDRRAAVLLGPHANLVLTLESGDRVTVEAGQPLPPGAFRVTGITVRAAARPEVRDALFDVAGRLARLDHVKDHFNKLALTAPDLARLAAAPAGGTLTILHLPRLELTGAVAGELKQFPVLTSLLIRAAAVDDALLDRLVRDVPQLRTLTLVACGDTGKMTPAGLAPLTRLPLTTLNLMWSKQLTPEWCAAIARMPGLTRVVLHHTSLDDALLAELAKSLKLTQLDVRGTRVTAAGVKQLPAEFLKRCKVLTGVAPPDPDDPDG